MACGADVQRPLQFRNVSWKDSVRPMISPPT